MQQDEESKDDLGHVKPARRGKGDVVPGTVRQTKVGGGWVGFRYFEEFRYFVGSTLSRDNTYALQSDQLSRWTVSPTGWRNRQSYCRGRVTGAAPLTK